MSTSTPPPEDPSFQMYEIGDVEAIGAHCGYEYCHQLDFLPFKCQSCGGKFCLDHRTEDGHRCPKKGAWAQRRRENNTSATTLPTTEKPSLLTSQQCSSPVCNTFVNTSQNLGVHCSTCNRTYCLKHRFPEDHDCKNLTPLSARTSEIAYREQKEKLRLGFGRLRSWGKAKQEEIKPKPKPTSKAAQLAALNKLKQTATGDAKVPQEKRLYLHCSATDKVTKDGEPKEAAMFFNTEWKVGRMLDVVAAKLGVENLNNSAQGTDKILRVYHVESGEVLEFSEKISQRMLSGNSIVLVRGLEV
ncbi:hypothetical protein LTR70_009888 [Exophiala xenobiotica]|uniref:AN1-type domain-containing protein n=1 Tax=Lithohypha guttulata TaxID=1690604 RepID=A0ABR0JXN6_9EURO|nr:hypothetical protein LTR24_009779 [Lithohypha guttulata]KAK5309927.1 hypothetical protein LTR70_009888 [Exophiala xenobiotica]